MKVFLIIFIFINILFFTVTQVVTASCTPIYGGGEVCTPGALSLQKKVLNPVTNSYVDTLNKNDPHYQPGDIISFQISINNESKSQQTNLKIIDSLPQVFVYNDSQGTYNNATREVTITIPNLAPNKINTYTIIGRIADNPTTIEKLSCSTNQAKIVNSKNTLAISASQFCIENVSINQPKKITTNPKSGSEIWSVVALLPLTTLGIYLRKKSMTLGSRTIS